MVPCAIHTAACVSFLHWKQAAAPTAANVFIRAEPVLPEIWATNTSFP